MTHVTVYTRPGCQPCIATKRKLTERGIAFVEADATEPMTVEALRYLGHREAPVVIMRPEGGSIEDETSWSGYRPDIIATIAA